MITSTLTARSSRRDFRGLLLAAFCSLGLTVLAPGAEATKKNYNLPAADAVKSLKAFSEQSGEQIVYPVDQVRGVKTNAVRGEFAAFEALERMLDKTGLSVVQDEKTGAFTVTRNPKADPNALRAAQNETSVRPEKTAMTETRVVELEKYTVTGSRLSRADSAGPQPILTLTRADFQREGVVSMAELISRVPVFASSVTDFVNTSSSGLGAGQSGLNLRGLGNGATLTLLNGRRLANSGNARQQGGNFVNINMIPLAAVERIEVLKDGSSAVYGSDAVAGVVNIILRKNFTGAEINASYRNTLDSDSSIMVGSATVGVANDRGSALVTIEKYRQNTLMATDRNFSASADQRLLGGPDLRTLPGTLGTVFAHTGSLNGIFLPNGQPATFAAIPAGQTGTGLTPASFTATAGQRDLLNQNQFIALVPPRSTLNIAAIFDYRLADAVNFFGHVLYSETTSVNFSATTGRQVTSPVGSFNFGGIILASNPFNPFGQDVRIEKNFTPEFGLGRREDDYHELNLTLGLKGALFAGWEWEAAYTHGRSRTDNIFNPINQNAVLANVKSTSAGSAFNFFGDPAAGPVNSDTKIAALVGSEIGAGLGRIDVYDVNVRGPLREVNGNKLSGVVGAEWRQDFYRQSYVSNAVDLQGPFFTFFNGVAQVRERTIKSLYAELALPLFTAAQSRRWARSLEITAAVRHEDTGINGTTTDPRFAVAWQPARGWLVRASYGSSFRVPTAQESRVTPLVLTSNIIDIRRGNEVRTVTVSEDTVNPLLRPEKSSNFSAGLVLEPPGVPGLTFSADYYRIEYKDKFTFISPSVALQFEDLLPGYVTRNAATAADTAAGFRGTVASIVQGYANLALVTIEGFDLEAHYKWDGAWGKWEASLVAAHPLRHTERVNPTAAAIERRGSLGYPPDWRGSAALHWNRGRWGVGLNYRFVSSYDYNGNGVFTPARRVASSRLFDVQASCRLPWRTQMTVGLNNVFDKAPPFIPAAGTTLGILGYDNISGFADPRGATFYVNLRKEF